MTIIYNDCVRHYKSTVFIEVTVIVTIFLEDFLEIRFGNNNQYGGMKSISYIQNFIFVHVNYYETINENFSLECKRARL